MLSTLFTDRLSGMSLHLWPSLMIGSGAPSAINHSGLTTLKGKYIIHLSNPYLEILAEDVRAEAGRLLHDADLALLLGRHDDPQYIRRVHALKAGLLERVAPQLHEGAGELVLGKGADGLALLGGPDGVHQLGEVLLVLVVLFPDEQLDVGYGAAAVQVGLQRLQELDFFLARQEHDGVLEWTITLKGLSVCTFTM